MYVKDKVRSVWVTSTKHRAGGRGDAAAEMIIPVSKIPSIEYNIPTELELEQAQTSRYVYELNSTQKCLWYFVSLLNVTTIDVNFLNEAYDLEITLIDAIMMLSATNFLIRYFETQRPILSVLWLMLVPWSMYSCSYLSLLQLKRSSFYGEEHITNNMMTAYKLLVVNLGLRFLIWTKVVDHVICDKAYEVLCTWKDILKYSCSTLRIFKAVLPININQ